MTEKQQQVSEAKPDVEAILAEIRAQAAASAEPERARAPEGLYENLVALNETCDVAAWRGSWKKRLSALVYRALGFGPLIRQLNVFHGSVVRVLNRLVAALDGTDPVLSGEILSRAGRRSDLVSQLSRRMAEYDAAQLAQRVRDLEARLEALVGKGRP